MPSQRRLLLWQASHALASLLRLCCVLDASGMSMSTMQKRGKGKLCANAETTQLYSFSTLNRSPTSAH